MNRFYIHQINYIMIWLLESAHQKVGFDFDSVETYGRMIDLYFATNLYFKLILPQSTRIGSLAHKY